MRICIHRGTHEIGGTCIELEAQGKRLVLDLGRPLDAQRDEEVPLPPVKGLAPGDSPDDSLLGVVISHPHQDHWGLLPQVAPKVPIYMGEAAANVLREAAFFSPGGIDAKPTGYLKDFVRFNLGPFAITPYLVDHSAFDAYSLLIEADGKRLFYTGDFRAHGRKAALVNRLIRKPPKSVDLLLMEGTMMQPDGGQARDEISEVDVEHRCTERFKATKGMALVCYSAQNLDRLVTLYRATLKADRDFVMDLYTATIARATGHSGIPKPGPEWPRVKVLVPIRQRVQVKEAGEFERVAWVRDCRIYPEQLASMQSRLVVTFRSSMARELERAGCLDGASVTWSLWDGYLEGDKRLREFLARSGCPLEVHHSSGHAFLADIDRHVTALNARVVVPVHTMAPERLAERWPNASTRRDGEWLEVT